MAPSRTWPSREDVLARLISRTLLDPWKILPLFALSQYTTKGQDLATSHPKLLKALRQLAALALLTRLSSWLTRRTLNNNLSDPYDWNQEIVVLTGGSNGIGQQIATLLSTHGIKVAILDISPPETTPTPLTTTTRFYKCDITSPTEIAHAASQIRSSLGTPTILINNAGICTGHTILSSTADQTRRIFDVNALSHYALAREFLPDMVSANHGMVVTVASQAGYTVTPSMVDYSASKAAAIAFHEGLAAELVTRYAAPRVRTVLVTQGFTRTGFIRGLTPEDTWVNPLLEAESVAEGVVGQVLKGESGVVVLPGVAGWVAVRLRGWPGWFGHLLRCRLERLMRS
ncbi:hypothetical protein N7541_000562 [Penicillium brevicompactum]|uniref:Short-chain dehydrogenase/reductase 3 n=1 Tax=Penicillium brevicompactum TaxID=5074 RepID=A0A9W9RUY2_PENBR|nr:hypothetical protein N7541_000562 [Penicillium brevicompactum]